MTFGPAIYTDASFHYFMSGSGCRLVAVPAFKAVWGAIALSPVGSIPTPSASDGDDVTFSLRGFRPTHEYIHEVV